MSFSNVYNDEHRAFAYSKLEFPGTYYLAFRDLPEIFARHVHGRSALDFGCGAGRSTRFLKKLGFEAVGIDISTSMIEVAQAADPYGKYDLIPDGDFNILDNRQFDLILSAFAFDNIPGADWRVNLLSGLGNLLKSDGRIVILGSTPDIYTHEWTSFTTKDFPRNRNAKSGEAVQIVMNDIPDSRPVVDLVWFHSDYLSLFDSCGLKLIEHYLPLGRADEPYEWLTETSVAPWVIYVVARESA
ncbi:MAG: class I SAM-dependent methyltransferase [Terracidiphilus sp.]|jgi:SAM-dependent methyltransferase